MNIGRKPTIIRAQLLAWGGLALAALIGTYGPHGPAVHPKMMIISFVLISVIAVTQLRMVTSRRVVFVTATLFVAAMIEIILVCNTDLGNHVHPIATTVTMLALGAIAVLTVLMGHADSPQQDSPK